MKRDKAIYVNGKWQLNPLENPSHYEYHEGDWFPKTVEKKKNTPKPQKKVKKMSCGTFPLGTIKEFCKVATLYILSGALGMSLALNVFWYMEKRTLELQNLQLLEIIQSSSNDK
jgi:hypothetical protein